VRSEIRVTTRASPGSAGAGACCCLLGFASNFFRVRSDSDRSLSSEEAKMADAAAQIAKSDQQLLNAIARRVEIERQLKPDLDYIQLLALKETIAELEIRNQRLGP
jgi:hypothetical protein